ncbi:unnamed protein product [Adineta steineri]|uniref:Sulfotransferase n=2 Tax=Adineta steineri TaxID=433720 RepID=A0A818LFL1_9BILA|nr:unnamed protein product [Adineta steineri]
MSLSANNDVNELCPLDCEGQRAYVCETCERMDYFIRTTINKHLPTAGVQFNQLPFLTESSCSDNEDVACLSNIQFQPIFITGIHRSGTTLLYEQLCKILPVAYVTPYSILYYNHLIEAEDNGQTSVYINALHKYFQLLGIRNRFIDTTPVSALNPSEEYCFVIGRQRNGRLSTSLPFTQNFPTLTSKSHKTFDSLCRKLIYIQKPKSNIVLLKNPWDYGNEAEILKLYPNAKFIHILRNPLEVINSLYSAMSHYANGIQFDPYVWTIGAPSFKSFICTERFISSLIGTNKAKKRTFNKANNMYLNNASIGINSIQSLPSNKVYTITYSNLIENPTEQLGLICQFIGIQVCQEQLSKHNCVKKPFKPSDILEENRQSIIEQLNKRNLPTNY